MKRRGSTATWLRGVAQLCAAALPLFVFGPAQAQSDDPEVVFWQSVAQSNDPAEIRAYLEAYPDGRFSSLARLRLKAATRATEASPPQPAAKVGAAWVRPTKGSVHLVDGIVLDMDATGLRGSSNLRLAVVPEGTPEAVENNPVFVDNSSSVPASRLHLTIPSGPPGRDEVRLYHIPPFGSDYRLAARAPVSVGPGAPGATLARDLTLEAERLGPLRFEANHRDRPMLVEAAFLRARPRTEWDVRWFNGSFREVPDRQTAVISIGLPNVVPDVYGSVGEVVCVVVADDQDQLDKIAGFQTGDPVLVRGIPTSWDSATARDPVVLQKCSLAQ